MNKYMFPSIHSLSCRNTFIDLLMIFLSKKIRYVYMFILIFLWFRNNHFKKVTYCAGISSVITLFLHFLIKLFYFKPRPFMKHRVCLLMHSKKDSSFPSKHTLLAFAVSTSIYLHNRIIGSIMWVLSVLTGISRIWVGHHYPSDIFGSALIATTISVIVDKIARFLNIFKDTPSSST